MHTSRVRARILGPWNGDSPIGAAIFRHQSIRGRPLDFTEYTATRKAVADITFAPDLLTGMTVCLLAIKAAYQLICLLR